MNFEPVFMAQSGTKTTMPLESETIKEKREKFRGDMATETAPLSDDKTIQPEELIQHIKALTEDGVVSVRFERNDVNKELIIKLIDQKTGKVTRQIPSEEILGTHKALADLRGNLIETES